MPRSKTAQVAFVGAGPGDPELLTLRAARMIGAADVVLHDRLVGPGVLALARADAELIETGKTAYGPSWRQEDIHALTIRLAREGRRVTRLKSGDCGVFGRLEEELDALDAAGLDWEIAPGVTAAAAGAAEIGRSLTRRGRNAGLHVMTGHDMAGFAEQDWRRLARPGEVAAIYMGRRAARFLQGRLLLHGADPATEITAIEHISRPERREIATDLARLPQALEAARFDGPVLMFLGLSPRRVAQARQEAA